MMTHVMSLAPTRRRWLIVLVVVLVPCVILNFSSTPDARDETILQNSIAELQVKLEHLHSKYLTSQEEIQMKLEHLHSKYLTSQEEIQMKLEHLHSKYLTRQEEIQMKLEHLHSKYLTSQEEIQMLTYQLVQMTDGTHLMPDMQAFINNSNANVTNLKLPNVYNFLPHLLSDPNSLRPAFIHSKGRTGVSVVLGTPTVQREVQSYLMATLKNLLDRMSPVETSDTLIVVLIAETDMEYVTYVAKQIEVQFPNEYELGIIDIISPHPSYYPDFSKLRDTMGDNHQRVTWRSKQNLDFAFLMSYAHTKGMFYVQLEDDILAKKNFITTMKSYALQKVSMKENWVVLDFCQLGFIGKLFKCIDLPSVVQFFLMFYNDKPVDWLLDNLISTRICSLDMDNKRCEVDKGELWLHYTPSRFQHVGTYSSLKGKVQRLKDEQFGKITLYYGHMNPDAVVESQIKPYKQFTLSKAYKGESFFLDLLPQPGDHLRFQFDHPIFIKKYLFRSGNAEHLSDKFYNTTVEVLPQSTNSVNRNHDNVTEDGYIIIGRFDSLGVARGTVDKKLGKIAVLRLTVHSESDNWAILSEIHIEEDSNS